MTPRSAATISGTAGTSNGLLVTRNGGVALTMAPLATPTPSGRWSTALSPGATAYSSAWRLSRTHNP